MKPTGKKYLLYGSAAIIGGILLLILIETVRAQNTGFETKTLWDWMELLIIPFVLAGGALFLQQSERAIERKAAENRADLDRKAAEERASLERELAVNRQQDIALQAYLDRMAELLLKEKLPESENEKVLNVARVRTLTVLRGLNAERNRIVLGFLHDIGLAGKTESKLFVHANLEGADLELANFSDTNLEGAFLQGANLQGAFLGGANLEGVYLQGTNLQNATLSLANLQRAILEGANLEGTNLHGANLERANLQDANLEHAYLKNANLQTARLLNTNLQDANLNGANLERALLYYANLKDAILQDANLKDAVLQYANLERAIVSKDQLATARSLEGATMPDGGQHNQP